MFREEDRALVLRPGFAFTIDFGLHTRQLTFGVFTESQSSLITADSKMS